MDLSAADNLSPRCFQVRVGPIWCEGEGGGLGSCSQEGAVSTRLRQDQVWNSTVFRSGEARLQALQLRLTALCLYHDLQTFSTSVSVGSSSDVVRHEPQKGRSRVQNWELGQPGGG